MLGEKLIQAYFTSAKALLKKGLDSEARLEQAIDKIELHAEKLHDQLEKHAPHLLTADETEISLIAEVGSDAIGTNTLAETNLAATLIKRPLVSVALASAESFAAAEGGAQVTAVATFSDVEGDDYSFTKVKTVTGSNFQVSKEILVGIDLLFWEGPDVEIVKEKNLIKDRLQTDIEDANVATVEFSAHAESENTLIYVAADATVVENVLSTAYVSAELFIA